MTDPKPPLHIVSLQAENVKRLVAVSITPTGNLVEITGRNGSGKTSCLDSIWWALGGAGALQSAPIRRGQDKARIRLDLGAYVVERKFARSDDGDFTTALTVTNAEGGRLEKGQTLVSSFLGSLTLDPLAFAHMKPREQFDMLKGFVTGADVEELEAANRTDFDKRTDVNRRAKEKAIEADAIPVPATTPAEKVDESALLEELAGVGKHNGEIEARKLRREAAAKEIESLRGTAKDDRDRAEELRIEAAGLDKDAAEGEAQAAALEEKLKAAGELPEPKDEADVRRRLNEAKATNAAVEKAARRAELKRQAAELEKEANTLSERIEARDKAKREAIAAAKLPVDGVEFADGAILLNGVPFDQASEAEKLRASAAIAMAGEPRLRVLRVKDGSLLDDDGLKLLATMAAERNFQVWVERVDSSGSRGFVIEDGHVRRTPEAPAAQAAE